MEQLNLTNEQEIDLQNSLLQCFKEYFKRFKSIILEPKQLIEIGKSQEEQQFVADAIRENEAYYSNLRDFKESGLDIHSWYENKLDEIAESLPTEDRVKETQAFKEAMGCLADAQVIEAIQDASEIEEEINSLKEETI